MRSNEILTKSVPAKTFHSEIFELNDEKNNRIIAISQCFVLKDSISKQSNEILTKSDVLATSQAETSELNNVAPQNMYF